MEDISKIILKLCLKKFCGIINLGSGEKTYLKDIAKIIAKKYNKKIVFEDNKFLTQLISNNRKLKNIVKIKLSKKN